MSDWFWTQPKPKKKKKTCPKLDDLVNVAFDLPSEGRAWVQVPWDGWCESNWCWCTWPLTATHFLLSASSLPADSTGAPAWCTRTHTHTHTHSIYKCTDDAEWKSWLMKLKSDKTGQRPFANVRKTHSLFSWRPPKLQVCEKGKKNSNKHNISWEEATQSETRITWKKNDWIFGEWCCVLTPNKVG